MFKIIKISKLVLIYFLLLCNVVIGQDNKLLKLELKNISNEIDNFESVKNIKNTILNKTLPIQSGDAVASIGVGYGWKEAIMDSLTQDVHYFLQDIVDEKKTEKRFEVNRKKYGSKVKQNTFSFVKGTILKTNLPNNHFDLIFISNTFHEFDEPDSMLIDIKSKLKPNGQLAINEYFSNQGNDFFYEGCKKHGYTFEAISKIMNKNGLYFYSSSAPIAAKSNVLIFKKQELVQSQAFDYLNELAFSNAVVSSKRFSEIENQFVKDKIAIDATYKDFRFFIKETARQFMCNLNFAQSQKLNDFLIKYYPETNPEDFTIGMSNYMNGHFDLASNHFTKVEKKFNTGEIRSYSKHLKENAMKFSKYQEVMTTEQLMTKETKYFRKISLVSSSFHVLLLVGGITYALSEIL